MEGKADLEIIKKFRNIGGRVPEQRTGMLSMSGMHHFSHSVDTT